MGVHYRHTQRGTLMLVVMLGGAAVMAAATVSIPSPARAPLWVLAVGFLVLGWLFSSLTVEADELELRWHFGPGLWTYRLARDEIETVRVVRNEWWYGFGIRMKPGFRLYNVSGLDAVELRLRAGDVRRIGTDDPQGLAAALRHRSGGGFDRGQSARL